MTTSTKATYNDEPEPTAAESKMTEVIAKDRPTIDAAVKSFISLICARSMSAASEGTAKEKVMMGIIPALAKSSISEKKNSNNVEGKNKSKSNPSTSIQQQVLQVARCILKAVNSYTFPIHDTVAYSMAEKPGTSAEKKEELLEISVVARLWNALVQSEQKPSRFLGKRALKLAWKNLDIEALLPPVENKEGVLGGNSTGETTTEESEDTQPRQNQGNDVRELQLEWLKQFEGLLFQSLEPLPSDIKIDDDSALLWAPDGGAAELAKRRSRRLDAAKERGPSTPS